MKLRGIVKKLLDKTWRKKNYYMKLRYINNEEQLDAR